MWFYPSDSVLDRYGDGEVVIIDQWVAAHGKVFVGKSYNWRWAGVVCANHEMCSSTHGEETI